MTWIDIRDPKENEKAPPSYEELSDNYGLLIQNYNLLEDSLSVTIYDNFSKDTDIEREMTSKEIFMDQIKTASNSLGQIQNNNLLTVQDIKSLLININNNLEKDESLIDKDTDIKGIGK